MGMVRLTSPSCIGPDLVAAHVKAIQHLKIDKVTVWDSGAANGGDGDRASGATANFLRGLIGSLPPLHELAKQAGIDLPDVLGTVSQEDAASEQPEPAKPDEKPHAAEDQEDGPEEV